MRIVSRKKIIEFYSKHSDSKTALEDWFHKVSKSEWKNYNHLKTTFGTADFVGNHRVVFNIKGNDYRLIAIVIYVSQKVYIRWIGKHNDYDKLDVKNI